MATLSEQLDVKVAVAAIGFGVVIALLVDMNERLDRVAEELQQMREMARADAMQELETEVED